MTIPFMSVCSGIEAASCALTPLGFEPVMLSEIDAGPVALLKYRWRAFDSRAGAAPRSWVPLWGDFSALRVRHMERLGIALPELLIGGTPCQSFSVAGKRLSLSDDRGNLALSFVRLARAIDARRLRAGKRGLTICWENVPGVLSTDDNAFGCLLAGFVGSDAALVSPLQRGRWPDAGMVAGPLARAAWRVLDAQYFGLAQRRERVFLVVSFRDGPDPARVLFEPAGVSRNPPSRRQAGEDVAGTLGSNAQGGFRTTDLDQQGAFIVEPPEAAWALQERDAKGVDSNTKDGHLLVEAFRVTSSEGGYSTGDKVDTLMGAKDPSSHVVIADAVQLTSPDNRSRPSSADGAGPTLSGSSLPLLFEGVTVVNGKDLTAPNDRTQPSPDVSPALRTDSRPLVFNCKSDAGDACEDLAPTARAMNADQANTNGGSQLAVMFKPSHFTRGKDGKPQDVAFGLSADADKGDQDPVRAAGAVVRRLTPREWERLFGFDDDYTLVPVRGKPASNSLRYRELGNSMAVPVIAWVGRRIKAELERARRPQPVEVDRAKAV